MGFELYIPKNLEFCDYIEIVQSARTFADGYDRKVCQIPAYHSFKLLY